ncbi:acylphosphatase [candidate division WOR-3 bacterium]|nr:acylphosphatase [candidate division WOR-3 bacterium]
MKKVIVSGDVQGVGFRYFVLKHCRRMNCRGWVRNLFDGTVEIVLDLKDEPLDDFLDYVKKESPGYVYGYNLEDIPDQNCKSFEIHF